MIQSPAGYQGDVRVKRYLDFYQAGYGVAMLSSGVAFSPLSLFAQGEQGGWYDPSDLTTLFQDAAGTTPVTAVEQPVGLVLDKSKGLVLGSELVTPAANRDFSSDTGFWTKDVGVTISGGKANWTNATQDYALVKSSFFSASRYYEVTFTISNYSSGGIKFFTNFSASSFTPAYTANGTYTVRFYYGAFYATTPFGFYASSTGTTLSVDDVSVRELPGNHLSQSTSTARPVLSARVNLLTRTEGAFNGSPWTKVNTTITDNTSETADPFGGSAASKVVETSATGLHEFYNNTGISFAGTNIISIYAKPSSAAGARTWIAMDYFTGSGNVTWFNLTGAGSVGTNASGNTPTITAVGNGWYRCTITRTATLTAFAAKIAESDGVVSYAGDTSKFMYFFGADARPTNAGVGLPAYQRVGASTDYDTTGFPLYLKFDGTDDSLSSAAINFTSTDKMSLFAGLRKITDGGALFVCELSANTNFTSGTFTMLAPANVPPSDTYSSSARGTASPAAGQGGIIPYSLVASRAPDTAVLTALHDISGDSSRLFRNGVEGTAGTTDKGTGNFANQPLYVGSRGNASNYLNGHLYSLIVVGRALTAAEITATETWVNSKTRAY